MRPSQLETLPDEVLEQIATEHDRELQVRRNRGPVDLGTRERADALVSAARAIIRRRKEDGK